MKYIFVHHLIPKSGRVLDVGCGLGVYCRFFESAGFEAYGIDLSREALKSSRQIRASITSIPFRRDYFDLVIAAHVIEHLPAIDTSKLLSEIARVLKSNGRVFLLTPNLFDISRAILRRKWMPDPTHTTMFHPVSLMRIMSHNFRDFQFQFRLPFSGSYNSEIVVPHEQGWLGPPGWFILTSTPVAYLRRVIHVSATVQKPGTE